MTYADAFTGMSSGAVPLKMEGALDLPRIELHRSSAKPKVDPILISPPPEEKHLKQDKREGERGKKSNQRKEITETGKNKNSA